MQQARQKWTLHTQNAAPVPNQRAGPGCDSSWIPAEAGPTGSARSGAASEQLLSSDGGDGGCSAQPPILARTPGETLTLAG
jgi:hypothetical protein